MREIPQAATDFVAAHEALRTESYLDPAGVYTIGYGHTGTDVHAGLRWTEDQCKSALDDDLKTAAARLGSVVSLDIIRELTDNQYAALLSFVFNLGNGADPKTGASPWTIWKRLNARQFDQVPVEMVRFVYCGGKKLQGLVNRRAAEVTLWSAGEPGSTTDDPPSSFTRAEPTPPVTADPRPVHKQPAFVATASAAVLGAPAAIKQVSDTVAPYADHSHYVQHAVELLATVGAGAAVAGVAVLWLQHRQSQH